MSEKDCWVPCATDLVTDSKPSVKVDPGQEKKRFRRVDVKERLNRKLPVVV